MRQLIVIAAVVWGSIAQAQDLAKPAQDSDSYDPTLSAKEALLANWQLAASGIRAGAVVIDNELQKVDDERSYEYMRGRANFALDLMIKRYNSADWAIVADDNIDPIDGRVLLEFAEASRVRCETDCGQHRADLLAAMESASAEMRAAYAVADHAVKRRKTEKDTVLMAEQLLAMAGYLEGFHWFSDLKLTAIGRDVEEVQTRLVGAMVLWRNLEPYVGIVSPEIDDQINLGSEQVLRNTRRLSRSPAPLRADSPEITALNASAKALAVDLRRAADLFKS